MSIVYRNETRTAGAHKTLGEIAVSVNAHDCQHGAVGSIHICMDSGNSSSSYHISIAAAKRIALALAKAAAEAEKHTLLEAA